MDYCETCSEQMDTCCGTGAPRCPNCDGPCLWHHDGPGPGEEDTEGCECMICGGIMEADDYCPTCSDLEQDSDCCSCGFVGDT